MERDRETRHLLHGRRKVEPRTKVPKNKRRVIEERLQRTIRGRKQGSLRQRIGPQHSGGFQPQTGRSEQWTVNPFREMDRPTPAQHQDLPGPSSTTSGRELYAPMQMEEGDIESQTDQDLSILEVPSIDWEGCGSKMRAICQNGTRTKSHSSRRQQLGSRKGCKRNRKKFLNRPTTANGRDHQRSNSIKNIGLSGTSTTEPNTRRIPTLQEDAIEPVRFGFH